MKREQKKHKDISLKKLLQLQRDFNEQILNVCFHTYFDENEKEKEKEKEKENNFLVRDFISGIITNAGELIEELGTLHYKYKKQDRDKILESLVDILKFWGNLVNSLNFSTKEILDKFYEKSVISVFRAQVEIKLRTVLAENSISKLALVDIDGILFPFPSLFYKFCKDKFNLSAEDIDRLKESDIIEYIKIKTAYRKSGLKRKHPPCKNAKLLLEKLRDKGYTILILSRRLRLNFLDTVYWLDKYSLPYDYLYFADILRERGRKGDVIRTLFQDDLTESKIEKLIVIDDDSSYVCEILSALKEKKFDLSRVETYLDLNAALKSIND